MYGSEFLVFSTTVTRLLTGKIWLVGTAGVHPV